MGVISLAVQKCVMIAFGNDDHDLDLDGVDALEPTGLDFPDSIVSGLGHQVGIDPDKAHRDDMRAVGPVADGGDGDRAKQRRPRTKWWNRIRTRQLHE